MSTATPPAAPACLVRPPWPDELPRLADAFALARFNRTLHPLLLIAPGPPERIVGFAGVLEPVGGSTGITFSLRPRHIDSPAADRLIAAALELAKSLGAATVRTADDLPPGGPLTPALLRAGFSIETTREIWELSPAALAPRLDLVQTRLAAVPRLTGLVIEPLTTSSLPGVKILLAAMDLWSPERRYNLESAYPNYDFSLSFAARRNDRIVAVALVKSHPRAAVLEVLTAGPEPCGGFDISRGLVLRAVVQASLAAGLHSLIFTTDHRSTTPLPQKILRAGGTRRGCIETFLWNHP